MSLISVAEALRRVLASIDGPVEAETAPLGDAHGRTLAADLAALRTQPPFPASAMDGYAVRAGDVASPPTSLRMVGRSIAGRRYAGFVAPGEAVRIFTGAPVPDGADAVVIQEDTDAGGDSVLVRERVDVGRHVRPSGLDFSEGARLLRAGARLDARHLALAAAMGHGTVSVRRRPRVALLATGDELVRPGEPTGPDQIVASNLAALAAITARAGGEAIDLGIARDRFEDLEIGVEAARTAEADLLVTLGGASVGEHDLVQSALSRQGMTVGFWRVALRPGKPLMHGRLGRMVILGLPGNPVSSIVCGLLFLEPAIRALQGDPDGDRDGSEPARLGADLSENDTRQDYLRAALQQRPGDLPIVTAHPVQDSSMLSVLARSDALIVRAPRAPSLRAGEVVPVLRLDRSL